jgi:LytS/YehU family sensor histidine kinase
VHTACQFWTVYVDRSSNEEAVEALSQAQSIEDLFRVLRLFEEGVQNSAESIIASMLQGGMHVNDVDALTGNSVLHFAVRSGAQGVGQDAKAASLVAALIKKGASVNVPALRTQMSPLHMAAQLNCLQTAKVCLLAISSLQLRHQDVVAILNVYYDYCHGWTGAPEQYQWRTRC